MRFNYILLAFLVAGCSEWKPPDNRLAWKPAFDSTYILSLDIVESDIREGDTGHSRKRMDVMLQRHGLPGNLSEMNMVIRHLGIRQRGVNLGTGKNGSIIVLPAGTMVTLSTDDNTTFESGDPFYRKYYEDHLKIFSRLKGDTIRLVMNEQGELQQLSGITQIIDSIAAQTAIDRRLVNSLLRDHISAEAIQDLFSQALFFLPGKEIKKGDHWVKNVLLVTKAPVKYSHLITVSDIRDGIVELSVKTSVSARLGEEGTQQYGEGEMTGKIIVDQATGMPLKGLLVESFLTHTNYYDVQKKRTISIGRCYSCL